MARMYPSSKYAAARPSSPTFVNFSPPSNYPSSQHHATTMPHHKHHHHQHNMIGSDTTAVTLDGRSEILFPNEIESIEFCVQDNGDGHMVSYPSETFSERRRRSRRSNHKLEVEQQVKWSRKNIAATMERFEPASKLEFNTMHIPNNHVYSYAYYEPGAAKCHTNVPHRGEISSSVPAIAAVAAATTPTAGPSKSPPRNSIRALLAKSFRSKTPQASSSSSEERHTYTTRYGTQENLYEEVNDQKIRKVLSDNRIVSTNSTMVKEELRRVQHNHFRVLDELNLSLEALIMPSTPPDTSPVAEVGGIGGISHQVVGNNNNNNGHLHSNSMENLSSTLTSIELKDHTCVNPEFDEGDLDSGFSGSGSSSGASYNESLRYYKTGAVMNPTTTTTTTITAATAAAAGAAATTSMMMMNGHAAANHHGNNCATTLPHMRSCRSSTSKSSMNSDSDQTTTPSSSMMTTASTNSSPFNFGRRCSDSQRSSASGAASGGTKPKKNFWTIKQ